MRVVSGRDKLLGRLEEARGEAQRTFGDGSVFLERYIARARHIEVQILADVHGSVVHLWERDCSVQRRHQKVVELAPAPNLSDELRDEICAAAIRVARTTGYVNAGTVEFLVDADTGEWFFIEVNPRIQVEHTVTEVVTGIDLVRSQFLVAQGCRLHKAPLSIPQQHEIPRRGTAIQCRITTEDPENEFSPDYGRLQTFRTAGGLGIRLDGTAYAGAVLSPFYDSLLVKLTAWDADVSGACTRADRALQEFRIRGVKTNIGFLRNVVNHEDFQNGAVTTHFLDETPELFDLKPARDRANRLLSFIGDTILNGNPTVAGKDHPKKLKPPPAVPFEQGSDPPPGTRQLLLELGPDRFAQWVWDRKCLLVTDTTFRDAHQSLLANPGPYLRSAGDGPGCGEAATEPVQRRDVGRRHLRRRAPLPLRRPVGAPAPAARGDPEHLLPDAAPSLQRGGLHQLPGQRRTRFHDRSRPAGHRCVPGLRLAQ